MLKIMVNHVREKKPKLNVLLQDKENIITIITYLKEEVKHLNSKLEGMTNSFCMLSYGSDTLD